MAEGMNRVLLVGNLGADPELRFTQGGQAVLNIRLATTERYMDREKNWQERTDWHSVVVWGKRAEALAKILRKGGQIAVEGGIRTSSYDDRDGNKRYKTEVHASNVILLSGKRGDDAGGGDDLGARETAHTRHDVPRTRPQQPDDVSQLPFGSADFDDIPF
ncbi:MAG TPA: single-stranded DNA-binding protein [Minicystis sp.]|nr:single-stranded DNA-binding protein [Minicystis sp.]